MNQQDQMREALRKSFTLGQRYWQQADSDYESEHKKSDETHQKYRQLVEETLQALAAEPAPLVRLTEEEAKAAYQSGIDESENRGIQSAAHWLGLKTVMDAMERVNGGQQ